MAIMLTAPKMVGPRAESETVAMAERQARTLPASPGAASVSAMDWRAGGEVAAKAVRAVLERKAVGRFVGIVATR